MSQAVKGKHVFPSLNNNSADVQQNARKAKKRIEWVDIGKGLGIVFVSFVHIRNGQCQSVWLPSLNTTINGFELFIMPIFYLLGGFTFSMRGGFKAFFIRKVRTLLVPYYFFSIYFLIKPVALLLDPRLTHTFKTQQGFYGHKNEILYQIYNVLINGNGLWYFAAFFVAEIIAYGLVKLCKSTVSKAVTGTVIVLATYAWSAFQLPQNLPFRAFDGIMISGYLLIGITLRSFFKNLHRPTAGIISVPTLLAVVICESLIVFDIVGNHASPFSHIVLDIVAAFGGGIGCICLAIFIARSKWLAAVGRNSLVYYALNAIALNITKLLLFHILKINAIHAAYWIQLFIGIVMVAISLVLLALANIIVQRWFWWSIGKTNPRHPKH